MVHNWTNRWSRFCHSGRAVSSLSRRGSMEEKSVICRRFSDLAVWSVLFIHPTLGAYSRNSTSLSFLALERSTDGGPPGMSNATSSNQVPVNRKVMENVPPSKPMRRDSSVPEHIDTNRVVKSPSLWGHNAETLENRRPPGRSSNLRVTRGSLSLRIRVPVNFGEVGGASHSSVFLTTRN